MLRGVSHDARNAADTLIKRFRVCDFYAPDTEHVNPPESPDQIIGTFQRFLQRGGKPQDLLLRLDDWRSAEDRARIVFGILGELASSRPPWHLQSLQLQGVPLSPELCATIAAAAPRPTCVKLRGYDMSGAGGADTPGGADTAGAVAQLLRAAAPGLQRLSLGGLRTAPGWAPHVLTALQQCTALRSLTLRIGRQRVPAPIHRRARGCISHFAFEQDVPLLQSLAGLPRLDTLKLRVNSEGGKVPWHALEDPGTKALAGPLCGLTGLTRLLLERADPNVVLEVLPDLRQLAVLELPDFCLAPGFSKTFHTAARSLTALRARNIDLSAPGRTARCHPGRHTLHLPDGLRSLEFTNYIILDTLSWLRLPANCTQLLVPGFRYRDRRKSSAQLLGALALLAEHGFDGALLRMPFVLLGRNLPDDSDLPGGFGALAAALRRLRLRGLTVHAKSINPELLRHVARELPSLEELELSCVPPSVLQHLRPLSRLRALSLRFTEVDADCEEELAQQLEALLDAAPLLRRLEVGCGPGASAEQELGAADAAVRLAHAALRRRGREPGIVRLLPALDTDTDEP